MDKVEEMKHEAFDCIDRKAEEENGDASFRLIHVSKIIKQLNQFIDGKIRLCDAQLDEWLAYLGAEFTVTLDIPLDKGLNIIRARILEPPRNPHHLMEVKDLTYRSIDDKASEIAKGRLNSKGESIFYGCISVVNNEDGINIAFSEIKAQEHDFVNTLLSTTTQDIKVRFIGIMDYYRRGERPAFYHHEIFREIYERQREKFYPDLLVASELCDAFFFDVMSREESDNVYEVTSRLAKIFLGDEHIDGVLYESVQAKSSPNIALKPRSVGGKLEYKEISCFKIKNDYGYAIYRADPICKVKVVGY